MNDTTNDSGLDWDGGMAGWLTEPTDWLAGWMHFRKQHNNHSDGSHASLICHHIILILLLLSISIIIIVFHLKSIRRKASVKSLKYLGSSAIYHATFDAIQNVVCEFKLEWMSKNMLSFEWPHELNTRPKYFCAFLSFSLLPYSSILSLVLSNFIPFVIIIIIIIIINIIIIISSLSTLPSSSINIMIYYYQLPMFSRLLDRPRHNIYIIIVTEHRQSHWSSSMPTPCECDGRVSSLKVSLSHSIICKIVWKRNEKR